MVKTALTHAAVWCGATLLGATLGWAAMLIGGVSPLWAISLPLLGYALGARFYLDRELTGPEPDFFQKNSWTARLDSFLDFVVPWALASALMYGVTLLYSVGGL